MDLTKLPTEILVEIIIRAGPRSIEANSVLYRAYMEYRHLIRAKWISAGMDVFPIELMDLKHLNELNQNSTTKYKIPCYPTGAALLHSDDDEAIEYALEHDLLELSQQTFIRLIGRPHLMSLVKVPLTDASMTEPLFARVYELNRELREQLYRMYNVSSPDYDLIEKTSKMIVERNDKEIMKNIDSMSASNCLTIFLEYIYSTLQIKDIIWFISFLDKADSGTHQHLFFSITKKHLNDVIEYAGKNNVRWSLYTNEWYVVASDNLELARAVSTDARLDSMAKSLYHGDENPASSSLLVVPQLYHFLFVEQWPRVEFTDVDINSVADRYTRRWGNKYDQGFVASNFTNRTGVVPCTPITGIKTVSCLKYTAKFDWVKMVMNAIEELVDHSPDGSYTSWFDAMYPKVGDGGKELGMRREGMWFIPDTDIKNGVPDTLPLTKTLLYVIEHTSEHIFFSPIFLNLPNNIFRILRPRLVYRGQPFNDDEFAQFITDDFSYLTYLDDRAGRWPCANNSDEFRKRSSVMCWPLFHTNNLKGLNIKFTETAQPTLDTPLTTPPDTTPDTTPLTSTTSTSTTSTPVVLSSHPTPVVPLTPSLPSTLSTQTAMMPLTPSPQTARKK